MRIRAVIAQTTRDPRLARRMLDAITIGVTGDPVMLAWLGLFLGRSIEQAA